jgi:hypothetical protein
MGPVLAGLALALVLLVGLATAAARAIRRRQRDEIRSIGHYHERLDTLHVEPLDRGGSVRVVDAVDLDPEPHREPGRPRLDADVARLGVAPLADPVAPSERRVRQWALGRTQPRARVDTATMLIVASVVAVMVALGVVGYVLGHDRTTSLPVRTTTSRSHHQPRDHRATSGGVADVVASTAAAVGAHAGVRFAAATPGSAVS